MLQFKKTGIHCSNVAFRYQKVTIQIFDAKTA